MALEVLDPGLLATVQDRGRSQVAEVGVSPSGFADWLSARTANCLVGNSQGAPLIETTLTGCALKALQPLRIAVTGAAALLTVNGAEKPLWRSFRVPANAEIKVGPAKLGLRSYVAVFGGIAVPLVLGSASTDLGAGFGGLEGRGLAPGDTLRVQPSEKEPSEEHIDVSPSLVPTWSPHALLRVLPGHHAATFTKQDFASLQHQKYRVSPRSSRQGVRLEGEGLQRTAGFDVLSTGVCAGCVQLSSDGLPIILLAEHQTTGGYAVPLTVISADTPDAAQLRPGDEVRFRLVSLPEAAIALTEKMKLLAQSLHHA